MNQWIAIHNAFDPFESVPAEKLEAWYVERPHSPLRPLLNELRPEKTPSRTILVGHPSSGKSTELTKLATELGKQNEYFVVRIDLDQNLDIERANPVEVIFLMGAAIYKVAAAQLDKKPDPSRLEQLKKGLETLVQTHTGNRDFSLNVSDLLENLVCFGASLIAGPVGKTVANLANKVIRPFRFVSGTDKEVVRKLEVEPKIETLVEALNSIVADVQEKAGKPLVLIVDGLDKPYDPDIIALNFAERNYLSKPACRVVYAAPMWVYYSSRFAAVRQRFPVLEFPNIKLYERRKRQRNTRAGKRQSMSRRKRDEHGFQVMREIVNKRLGALGLMPDKVIETTALDRLIHASGGVVRDLIRLIRDVASDAEIAGASSITKKLAEKAVARLRRQYEAQLLPKDREILVKVHQTHQRTDDEICDLLLQGNFVLSYVNDEVWFDTHSLLQPFADE